MNPIAQVHVDHSKNNKRTQIAFCRGMKSPLQWRCYHPGKTSANRVFEAMLGVKPCTAGFFEEGVYISYVIRPHEIT